MLYTFKVKDRIIRASSGPLDFSNEIESGNGNQDGGDEGGGGGKDGIDIIFPPLERIIDITSHMERWFFHPLVHSYRGYFDFRTDLDIPVDYIKKYFMPNEIPHDLSMTNRMVARYLIMDRLGWPGNPYTDNLTFKDNNRIQCLTEILDMMKQGISLADAKQKVRYEFNDFDWFDDIIGNKYDDLMSTYPNIILPRDYREMKLDDKVGYATQVNRNYGDSPYQLLAVGMQQWTVRDIEVNPVKEPIERTIETRMLFYHRPLRLFLNSGIPNDGTNLLLGDLFLDDNGNELPQITNYGGWRGYGDYDWLLSQSNGPLPWQFFRDVVRQGEEIHLPKNLEFENMKLMACSFEVESRP